MNSLDLTPLRRIRKQKKLSVRQLSELSGISASTIVRIENGKDTSFSIVQQYAQALGYSLLLHLALEPMVYVKPEFN